MSDSLIDAVLKQSAATQGGDDEEFLAQVEAAIDRDDSKSKSKRLLLWIPAGVAALSLLLVSIFKPEATEPVAETGTQETETADLPVIPEDPAIPAIASNYVIRLQERTKQADEAAHRGRTLLSEGDLQGAIDQYRASLDLLPEAPMTESRKEAYREQFANASVSLATQRAEEGRYPEAIALVEDVLAPNIFNEHPESLQLLERLNDPDYYSPALTPNHLERIRRVKLAQQTAQGYVDLGDSTRATREYHKALSEDPYNTASRRTTEYNERHQRNYYDQSYNHTRAKMLREVAEGWEMPVPEAVESSSADSTRDERFAQIGHGGKDSTVSSRDKNEIQWENHDASFGAFAGGSIVLENHVRTSGSGSIDLIAGWTGNPSIDVGSNFGALRISEFKGQDGTTPRYSALIDNVWTSPTTTPLSTFSIDVDTASWTNIRNMIRNGTGLTAIPNDAVRIEEMINYFSWDYDQPEGEHPFALATEISDCPWNEEHQLLRIGIQGEAGLSSTRPAANLVFLIDVSGSMDQLQKLPLVKRSISVLTEELDEDDRISIVVYAGSEGLALPATPGSEKAAIHRAIENLNAGGSTNGGAGIKLAYRLAKENRIEEGINRVILCTDGDFNVGVTGTEELAQLVETGADEKIAISVLGFGQDNLNDGMLETITNRGDGNYFYIDSFREARKAFLSDLMGTLVTIARDVKIQIEFNPAEVESYRLIGYANRRLNKEDFDNDEIDAGDIGSGHSVTALYEIIPNTGNGKAPDDSELRYQSSAKAEERAPSATLDELAFLKLRYKKPESDQSTLVEQVVEQQDDQPDKASVDQNFASAVSLFGLILRDHRSAEGAQIEDVLRLANAGLGKDEEGYRAEFIDIVRKVQE